MGETIKLLLAVFSFGKELFAYLRDKDESNKICTAKIQGVTDALKQTKETKDTSTLENAFKSAVSH